MPEFYAEPMKDRRSCSVCKMTVKGKKVLLTCIKCHAITYCGVECQKTDWERHEWNCDPVMVTEFPGKGRGLVAARDIEKGELIFLDKPVIEFAVNAKDHFMDPEFMTSLKAQIESLPSEAKAQYYKLATRDIANIYHVNRGDFEVLKLFMSNSKISTTYHKGEDKYYDVLNLNIALINHSCIPNARSAPAFVKQDGDIDLSVELRAIKRICKGEEITTCYFHDVKKLGSIPRKRKTAFKKYHGFDCKCPLCLGQVQDQEKTLKKLIDLHNKLMPTPSDWKREACLWSRIVDLTMELYIGQTREKISALESMLGFAHLARDRDLVMKAMTLAKDFVEETKIESMHMLESWEMDLAKWSKEFSSNNAPRKEEIDYFFPKSK